MDFEAIWTIAEIGNDVTANNGEPEPPRDEIARWANWRQVNFTGTIVEKSPGQLVVRLPADDTGSPVFTLTAQTQCSYDLPQPEVTLAEKMALDMVEAAAEEACKGSARRLWRQLAIDVLWHEVQMLKLTQDAGLYAGLTALERGLRFPNLAMLAQQSGASIPTVATALQNRLQARVERVARIRAKQLLGHDAVRAATTAEDKLAAAESIVWD